MLDVLTQRIERINLLIAKLEKSWDAGTHEDSTNYDISQALVALYALRAEYRQQQIIQFTEQ